MPISPCCCSLMHIAASPLKDTVTKASECCRRFALFETVVWFCAADGSGFLTLSDALGEAQEVKTKSVTKGMIECFFIAAILSNSRLEAQLLYFAMLRVCALAETRQLVASG